ncbi:glycosyltransferase [Kitasatospora sp. NPDC057904]|uniref:glycosyltransferase n=1 Tax=unclassified Kitasatospora TaxID=2633591 RepID=UPI0036D9F54D
MDRNPAIVLSAPRRVVLATWGTAGDIAPYAGLAAGLKKAGHDVVVVTSGRHAATFHGLALKVRAMPLDRQEAEIGQPRARRARRDNARDMALIAAEHLLAAAGAGADVLLAHPLLHPQAALVGRGLDIPCIGVYTVSHAMMLPRLVTGGSHGRYRATDALVRLVLSPIYRSANGYLRRELNLPRGRMEDLRLPLSTCAVRYGFSAALMPRGVRIPAPHRVVGAWHPQRAAGWRPDARLVDFLDSGPAPVYFGFGSMTGIDVEQLADTVTTVVRRLGVRAVVQGGWAGLEARGDDVLNIGPCPHDWLLPRMRAAVHHAGPGTVHACLRAMTPALPVPVGLDQPFWSSRLRALGLTPAVIPQRRLNADNLGWALDRLLEGHEYRVRTQEIGRLVGRQDGTAALLEELG